MNKRSKDNDKKNKEGGGGGGGNIETRRIPELES